VPGDHPQNGRTCGCYRSAAAAQEAGFRACKRWPPGRLPGSPEWNIPGRRGGPGDAADRDGIVDRHGVEALADRLGYEQRQVRRLVTAELGAGPLAIARAQRAQTARILTETNHAALSEIAFAAGFASIRQFNSDHARGLRGDADAAARCARDRQDGGRAAGAYYRP